MSLEKIELLITNVSELLKEEAKKPKIGKMSLLSMFRHGYENSHSDVLGFLLDPKGEHAHGDEYLRLFLKEIGLEDLLKNLKRNLTECTVKRKSARIDLYIKHPEFSLIIENKIYARDQESQLQRYYNIVTKEWGVPSDKVYILYLILRGYEASDDSQGELKDNVFQEMQGAGRYFNISYTVHILQWLINLPFKPEENTLRSAIEQYTYNIEILTNQTKEENEMKHKIIEMIKKENKEMELSSSDCENIRDAFNEYIHHIRIEKWTKIEDLIQEKITMLENHKIIYTIGAKISDRNAVNKWIQNDKKNCNIGVGIQI